MAQQRRRVRRVQQSPKKRHWCFTSFAVELPTTFDPLVVRYVIYQTEICPETKTTHFQGYIEFHDGKRMGQVKAVLGECRLAFRAGSRTQAREYCRKEETAVPDTVVEWGEWRGDVSRKRKLHDLLKADMTLDEFIAEAPEHYVRYHRGIEKLIARRTAALVKEFRKVTVETLVGPTGCGKTRRAVSYPDHYMKPKGDRVWFDGYEDQAVLIIDDFYGDIKYGLLLNILDGYELMLPVKGGFIWAQWTKVVITSNADPKDWYKRGYTPALERRLTTNGSKIIYMV